MKNNFLAATLIMISAISNAPAPGTSAAAYLTANRTTAFVDVAVVPMDSERVIEHQTVIVRDGRISEIGPADKTKVPSGTAKVNGRGMYLMPGLVDMHIHVRHAGDFLLYLANGVTTVRNMRGDERHLRWRAAIETGEILAPTLYTTGPFTNQPEIKTPEQAERAVLAQKAAGYDAVKIHGDFTREAYERLCTVANREGIPVVGHAPRNLPFDLVLKNKQSELAHVEEYIYTYFKAGLDESKIAELAAATRDAGISITTTLVAYDRIGRQVENLDALLQEPSASYVSPYERATWERETNSYLTSFAPSDVPMLRRRLAFQKKLVGALQRAGVRVMLGTDATGPTWVPGWTAIEELRNLTGAGLTPFEALKAATYNPAEFLKAFDEFGTVSVGKRADLILVRGNPLRDVANVSRRAGVMVRGTWLPESALRRSLNEKLRQNREEEKLVNGILSRGLKSAATRRCDSGPLSEDAQKLLDLRLSNRFAQIILARGPEEAIRVAADIKKACPAVGLFTERGINNLGYVHLLRNKQPKEAIKIFRFNVVAFPDSFNVYDSLGEAYMVDGQRDLAIVNYRKSLELNPANTNGADMLKKLTAEK